MAQVIPDFMANPIGGNRHKAMRCLEISMGRILKMSRQVLDYRRNSGEWGV